MSDILSMLLGGVAVVGVAAGHWGNRRAGDGLTPEDVHRMPVYEAAGRWGYAVGLASGVLAVVVKVIGG